MVIDRRLLIRQAGELTLFGAIGGLQGFLMCSSCVTPADYALVMSFTILMWIMLWKGNDVLAGWLSAKISWIDFPVKRFVIGVIVTIGYTAGAVIGLMALYSHFFGLRFGQGYLYTVYASVLITALISLFLHGRSFLLHWRQATLDREKYLRESITARYESLRNQVNPHFLFNSLNALTTLVHSDPDRAVQFIKQLSEVYRYVLDTRDREVVTLKEELEFLKSYLYLEKIRYGEKLSVSIDLENALHFCVAPLALQMLAENAIKHNVVGEDQPLSIRIFHDDGYMVVENTLQKKMIAKDPAAGVGLENICRRYELLSNSKVIVREDDNVFSVRLPLLETPLA